MASQKVFCEVIYYDLHNSSDVYVYRCKNGRQNSLW